MRSGDEFFPPKAAGYIHDKIRQGRILKEKINKATP
jgi:hypothetical protein